jgi:hypothetical protein
MIASMFDHMCRVRTFAETVTGAQRSLISSYSAESASAEEPCALGSAKFGATDGGKGNRREGSTLVYLGIDASLARNDVLEVFDGPNAPVNLKVLSVDRPRGHHTECICEPFTGAL